MHSATVAFLLLSDVLAFGKEVSVGNPSIDAEDFIYKVLVNLIPGALNIRPLRHLDQDKTTLAKVRSDRSRSQVTSHTKPWFSTSHLLFPARHAMFLAPPSQPVPQSLLQIRGGLLTSHAQGEVEQLALASDTAVIAAAAAVLQGQWERLQNFYRQLTNIRAELVDAGRDAKAKAKAPTVISNEHTEHCHGCFDEQSLSELAQQLAVLEQLGAELKEAVAAANKQAAVSALEAALLKPSAKAATHEGQLSSGRSDAAMTAATAATAAFLAGRAEAAAAALAEQIQATSQHIQVRAEAAQKAAEATVQATALAATPSVEARQTQATARFATRYATSALRSAQAAAREAAAARASAIATAKNARAAVAAAEEAAAEQQ